MMREHNWDLTSPVPGEADDPSSSSSSQPFGIPDLLQPPGSSSGSYLQNLIDSHYSSSSSLVLTNRKIRNDYEEFILSDPETGAVVFKGAKCYGFRNLQNVVRKVGREQGLSVTRGAAAGKMEGGRSARGGAGIRAVARRRAAAKAGVEGSAGAEESAVSASVSRGYDYIEVMACPGGCVNGGGQIKAPSRIASTTGTLDEEGFARNWEQGGAVPTATPSAESGLDMTASERWGDKEWVKKVEAAYWNGLPTPPPSPPGSIASLPSSVAGSMGLKRDAMDVPESFDIADTLAETVVRELSGGDVGRRVELFRTSYRAVESEVVGLAVKW